MFWIQRVDVPRRDLRLICTALMGTREYVISLETNADGRTDQQIHRSLNWGCMNWCFMLVNIFWQQGRRGQTPNSWT